MYQIAPLKAVVGVDRPMKAPCMYIQTPYYGKLSKFSLLSFYQKIFFLKQTPSCICSMCLHCIGKVSNCSIKSCGRSLSALEGTINAYTEAILGKNGLSSRSCLFVKKYFFLNQAPSCICSMCLHCIGKVSNCSIKSCGKS